MQHLHKNQFFHNIAISTETTKKESPAGKGLNVYGEYTRSPEDIINYLIDFASLKSREIDLKRYHGIYESIVSPFENKVITTICFSI